MAAPLKLSLLIDADASKLKSEAQASVQAVKAIGAAGEQNSAGLRAMATASDEAAESLRRARDAQGRFVGGGSGGATGAKVFADEAKRAGVEAAKSVGLAQHEVSNLSAQLADLGVQIAGGGSPLMAMIQQGPQIADILGGRGLTGIIAGVGQGVLSLVNPVTLGLAAVTALGYGASAVFDAMSDGAGEATLSVEEQNEAVRNAAGTFRAALPEVAAYNAELERKNRLEEAKQATQVVVQSKYETARGRVNPLSDDMVDFSFRAKEAGATYELQRQLTEQLNALKTGIADATATGKQARDLAATVTEIVNSTGISGTNLYGDNFANTLNDVSKVLDRAGAAAKPVRDSLDAVTRGAQAGAGQMRALAQETNGYVDALERLKRAGTPELSAVDQINADFQRAASSGFNDARDMAELRRRREAALQMEENKRLGALVPTPTERPNGEDMASEAWEAAQRTGRKNESTADRLQKQRDAQIARQRDQLELLRAEAGAVNLTDSARAAMIETLKTEQEIRRLGIDAQSDEANAMRANTAEIVRLNAERAASEKRKQEAQAAWQERRSLAQGVFGDLMAPLKEGEKSWDAWAKAGERAVNRVRDRIFDSIGENLLDAFMPQPGAAGGKPGGVLSFLFGPKGKPGSAVASAAEEASRGVLGGLVPDGSPLAPTFVSFAGLESAE